MTELSLIKLKEYHNYVACFLTLSCNLRCPHCINLHNGLPQSVQTKRRHLTAEKWTKAINRLVLRDDLPLTLQGGEPTLYEGFYKLVNEVKDEIKMDLLTNMMFDVDEFIKNVPVKRFTREAPYAAIRASYHPGQNDIDDLITKTMRLRDAGFRIGIYGILLPDKEWQRDLLAAKDKCLNIGIDFRTKEFLGLYGGASYGTFKYEDAIRGEKTLSCECRINELIMDPAGYVYRCHADLYKARGPIAHILNEGFNEQTIDDFRECRHYGDCNPCDVKVKTDRFQVFGHTSVEIRNLSGLPPRD